MKNIYKTLVSIIIGLITTVSIAYAALPVTQPVNGGTGTSTIPTIGQVLVGSSNGTYAPVATSTLGFGTGNGTVTSVTCGTGLSGGTITTSGTCTNAGVTSIIAGSNISVSGATGAVTISSTGGSGSSTIIVGGSGISVSTSGATSTITNIATTTAARLGFVATGAEFNPKTGSFTSLMSRNYHIARTNINALQLAFQNYTTSEAPFGGMASVTATIEYPANTFTRVTFSGIGTGTIPAGGTLFSDYVTLTTPIPAGAIFWVRDYYVNAAGTLIIDNADSNSGYDSYNGAVGLVPDQTATPGLGSMSSGIYAYEPIAIIGSTTLPSVLYIGDSRMYGTGETGGATDNTGGVGYENRLTAGYYGSAGLGQPGDTLTSFLATSTQRMKLAPYASVVIGELGVNDINNSGLSGASTTALVSTLAAKFTVPVYWTTFEPYTASTDNYVTLANQTPTGNNTGRVAFNDLLRQGSVSGLAGYIDLAAVSESSLDSGLWAVNGTSFWLTSDGLHGTTLDNQNIKTAVGNVLNNTQPFLSSLGGLVNGVLNVSTRVISPCFAATASSSCGTGGTGSSTIVLAGTGISVATTSTSSTVTNIGVTSILAGTNISISNATGTVTINSTGGGSGTNYFTNVGGLTGTTSLATGTVLMASNVTAGIVNATSSINLTTSTTTKGTETFTDVRNGKVWSIYTDTDPAFGVSSSLFITATNLSDLGGRIYFGSASNPVGALNFSNVSLFESVPYSLLQKVSTDGNYCPVNNCSVLGNTGGDLVLNYGGVGYIANGESGNEVPSLAFKSYLNNTSAFRGNPTGNSAYIFDTGTTSIGLSNYPHSSWRINGTNVMALSNTGSLILGTATTSTSTLDVTGTSTLNGSLTVTSTTTLLGCIATSTGGACVTFGGGTGTNYFTNSSASTTLTTGSILIANTIVATSTTGTSTFAGALGIGTTTPGTILSVVGTTTTSGLRIPGITNSVAGFDANGNLIATTTSGGGGSGTVNSGTAGQTAFYATTGTAVSGTSTMVYVNQNVGIGSTTPYAKVAIQGVAGNGQDLLYVATTTNGTGSTTEILQADSLGNVNININPTNSKGDIANLNVAGSIFATANSGGGNSGYGVYMKAPSFASFGGLIGYANQNLNGNDLFVGNNMIGLIDGTTFELGVNVAGGGSNNVSLINDATGFLAIRDAVQSDSLRVYNTFTSATNFERAAIKWSGNALTVGTELGSAGGTGRDFNLEASNTVMMTLKANGNIGFGTTTPSYAFTVASTTSSTTLNFAVDGNGNQYGGGLIPSVACASTCTLDSHAHDSGGIINVSGSQTIVTLTFATAKPWAPACTVSDNITTAQYDGSTTLTTLVMTTPTSIGAGTISYICQQ